MQIFAFVVAVPLAIVGGIALLGIWNVSRSQLNESVKQQAELATIAFDRWAKAQQEPLTSISASVQEEAATAGSLSEDLRHLLQARPYWIDVRIISSSRQNIAAEPGGTEVPPSAMLDYLFNQTRTHSVWMASDRTSSFSEPVMAIAVPTSTGGAVIARIRSSAIDELFRTIQFNDGSVIAVLDAEGHILYRRQTTETPIDREVSGSSLFSAAGTDRAAMTEVESPYDGVRRLYGVRASAMNSVVIVGIPSAVLYEPARRRFTMYLFFSLITLACAVIAGMFISSSITRPIRQLQETTQAFGADQITARAAVNDSGEIGELASAFNNMADKIVEREEKLKELDRLKSEFVGNVSHELRTPLTTIKTLTHVLQRKTNGDRDLQEHLETIAAECDRQIDLVSNLLDLSRIEAGAYRIDLVGVNPSELLVSCVSRLAHNAEAHHEDLRLELPSDLPMVRASHAALRRVLCNLIENAIKYTPNGGTISVGARAEDDQVAIYVRDSGPGICEEEIPRIFDKFYRADPANAKGSQADSEPAGVGLGLYIVRNIMNQLGGRVTARNGEAGGAVFTVHLPRWLPAENEEGNGSKA